MNFGKGQKPEGESAVDDDGSDRLEELAESISALGMTGLLMEPIYRKASNPPPIPPLPGSEEEQAAGSMEMIGEEDEEEKSSAAEAVPESALETASGLVADQEPLDTSRMVGLTIVYRSTTWAIPDGITGILQPSLRARTREPLFPMNFSTLSIGPTLPARSVPFLFLCAFSCFSFLKGATCDIRFPTHS